MHYCGPFDATKFAVPASCAKRSTGYETVSLIDRSVGAVHMAVGICNLAPDGRVDGRMHAFEKGIYVLKGELELSRDGHAFTLSADDFALIPYGTPYSLRNPGGTGTQWLEMQAPQPKESGDWKDTYFVDEPIAQRKPVRPDATSTLLQMVGRFKTSGSHSPHGMNIHGLTVYRFMDRQFGAQQFLMMRGELAKGGVCGLHDHPIEESYFVLEGEADMEIEGKIYPLRPGVVAWTGVGASHAFFQRGDVPLRWIETQSPPFPPQHSLRNYAQWENLRGVDKS